MSKLVSTPENKSNTNEAAQQELLNFTGRLNAINHTFAIIEFDPTGHLLTANELFQQRMGYKLSEVEGKHHSMFLFDEDAIDPNYTAFWDLIKQGMPQQGQFRRQSKTGDAVWLQASYAPIKDESGKLVKVLAIATDITATKLQSAEWQSKLQALDSYQAVIEFQMDGTIIKANDIFLNVVGFELREVAGKHHSMFVDSSYARSEEYKEFWAKLNAGKHQDGEYRRIRKNGEEIWLQARYFPLFNNKGQATKVIKYASDITQKKKIALGGENERFRNMQALEQAVDAIINIDEHKNIQFFNAAAEKMFGYTRQEVMGQNVKMIVPMEHQGRHDQYVDNNVRTGVNKVIGLGRDLEMVRKNGDKFWGNLSLSKVEIEGKYLFTAFIKDVTEQKEFLIKQERLQTELETRMNQINVACLVSESDLKGNILSVNDKLLEVTQYTREECIGQPHNMFRHPDSPKEVFKEMWSTIGRGSIFRGVIKNRKKDGSPYWVDAIIAPVLGPNGKPVKYIGVRYDITEQIQKEEELKKSMEEQAEIIEVIKGIAVGDLSQRVKSNTQIAKAVNASLDKLNELLMSIDESAKVVSRSSDSLLQRSESIRKSSNEVASAISQMAKGAQDQALKTDESSKLVGEVMTTSNAMKLKAEIINKTSENGQKSSDEGIRIISKLVDNMGGINQSADQTSRSIEVLTERAEEIGRTLNVITDIASQTNLLALNAAIEAARAGDAGRGFAVVAEEIRKLAEGSRKSAVDIEKIIKDVQKDTTSAAKAIESMQTSVKSGASATKDAESIFVEIAQANKETFNHSKEILEATNGQKSSIEAVVKNIEQIVVVAEETAAGTQQVASSSQELNAGMAEISSASNQLTQIAEELKQGVNSFKLLKK